MSDHHSVVDGDCGGLQSNAGVETTSMAKSPPVKWSETAAADRLDFLHLGHSNDSTAVTGAGSFAAVREAAMAHSPVEADGDGKPCSGGGGLDGCCYCCSPCSSISRRSMATLSTMMVTERPGKVSGHRWRVDEGCIGLWWLINE